MHTDLQAILDATMDVVAVFDSERHFVTVNAAACQFYGRTREELLGSRLDDFIGAERAEADWQGFLDPERIAEGMLENVWDGVQDGRRMVLEVRARPEFLPDRHLFVLRDITERAVLEDQLRQAQKMEAVGQLAGGVAHDFNNLLTVISGYGEIARRRIGAGPGANELREIQRASDRAGELTRQLLVFGRKQVLEPVLLDVNEVASGLLPMLSRLIGETIEIAMLASNQLPPVLADRAQLEQVVINLAINARDAMPGGGTLAIETSATGEHVRLTVSDTGSGIEPAVLEHIFEPFYTTKEVGLGTGLGLATVHGIVTQSGGRVEVVSDPGLGSTFAVLLPAAAAGDRMRVTPAVRVPRLVRGSETLLLCEDEEGVRTLLDLVLSDAGYTVLSAARPEEALAIAQREGVVIDALVTDIVMPGMSGLELAERLAPLRALFISGYSADAATSGDLPPGSGLLQKPFDHTRLLSEVRALLDLPAHTI